MAATVRYMGSKRSLAPDIASIISKRHPSADVLDVFSGMCAVGSELAPNHTVLCNDVHAFAEVVATALFVADQPTPTSLIARDELLEDISRNYDALADALVQELAAEKEALARVDTLLGWHAFCDLSHREMARPIPFEIPTLPSLEIYRRRPKTFPYCLFTRYFANGYFGLEQAMMIDSIRYAIDRAAPGRCPHYINALLQATSHCASTPGHFAQFLAPRDRKTTRYIGRIRQRDVFARFCGALDSAQSVSSKRKASNRVYRSDASELLVRRRTELAARELVIYADPPYSKAQYSRYYHVLETLALYDYPQCSSKGRYRGGRFNTDFSRVAGVVGAMDAFVAAAAKTGGDLYLSYPSSGLLGKAGENLGDLIKRHYPVSQIVAREPLDHSTMGGAPGSASVSVFEEVYYGGWKR